MDENKVDKIENIKLKYAKIETAKEVVNRFYEKGACFQDLYVKYCDYCVQKEIPQGKRFKRENIRHEYDKLVRSIRAQFVSSLATSIFIDKKYYNDDAWSIFESEFLDDKESKIGVAVLKHGLQTVGRKMLNMPVKDQMVINFFGEQGSGKSFMLDCLLKPLQPITKNGCSVDSFLHDFKASTLFESYYIVIMNELSGLSKADKDLFKDRISQTEVAVRPIRQEEIVLKQTVTIFSTSNTKINYIFKDSTGNRRFYDILIKLFSDLRNPSGERRKYRDELWQDKDLAFRLLNSIDLNEDYYSIAVKEGLHEVQLSVRHQEPIDKFIETVNLENGDRHLKLISIKSLFELYCVCNLGYRFTLTKTDFDDLLKQKGFNVITSKGYKYVKLSECSLDNVMTLQGELQASPQYLR